MGEVRADTGGNGSVPRAQGGDASRDDADADFPGAPVPIEDAVPGWIRVDVLPVQDRADYATCGGAVRANMVSEESRWWPKKRKITGRT